MLFSSVIQWVHNSFLGKFSSTQVKSQTSNYYIYDFEGYFQLDTT